MNLGSPCFYLRTTGITELRGETRDSCTLGKHYQWTTWTKYKVKTEPLSHVTGQPLSFMVGLSLPH